MLYKEQLHILFQSIFARLVYYRVVIEMYLENNKILIHLRYLTTTTTTTVIIQFPLLVVMMYFVILQSYGVFIFFSKGVFGQNSVILMTSDF